MNHPRIPEPRERSAYTCMLWNVRSGRPTVVSIHGERHDRWLGRRCTVAMVSFEAPVEIFMKSEWSHAEVPAVDEPEAAAPAPVARTASRGFHP
jgi:hypothetical protein